MALLFTLTAFLAAFLLFSIQPLVARLLLPPLGGSPMVWNTAMVFFQAALLGGYLYAHWMGARLTVKPRAALLAHGALLLLPFLFLPIGIPADLTAPQSAQPIGWLLGVLALCAGVPFMLVATCSPFLQRLFALSGHRDARDPYFLYAASNIGSFSALLAYPILLEPELALNLQSRFWMIGYAVLVGLLWTCFALVLRAGTAEVGAQTEVEAPPAPLATKRIGRWVLLAFVPSSLMLSLTNFLSSDVAAIPLLWIVPLSLYLLSFVVVFARRQIVPQSVWPRALVILLLPLVIALAAHATEPLQVLVPLHVLTFFLAAIVCHGELSRDRPAPAQLTAFYGWMALGGVLGGAFNSLLAPLIFSSVVEYPLTIVMVCLLLPRDLLMDKAQLARAKSAVASAKSRLAPLAAPLAIGAFSLLMMLFLPRVGIKSGPLALALMFGLPALLCFPLSRKPLAFATGVGAILACGSFYATEMSTQILEQKRSFFGVHRVLESPDGRFHYLAHGSTLHGIGRVDEPREPTSYYTRRGPLGDVMKMVSDRPNLRIAVVGLGAGSIGGYARQGEQWTFYEIDPLVAQIASDPKLFQFLSGSPAPTKIVLGDARQELVSAADGAYDVLVLDAYSSDTIPVHLLTREALEIYRRKLAPGGVLVWHISNKYFDLEPVVGKLAQAGGWQARIRRDLNIDPQSKVHDGIASSVWAVLARDEATLGNLTRNAAWKKMETDADEWSDQKSSLWPLLVKR